MEALYQIRADYDANTIVMYQAYGDPIADAALSAGRFVPPFSLRRMTWIKPSFLWLMHRSRWGTKPGQQRILAVRILRSGFDEALSRAVLTQPESRVHGSRAAWREAFEAADVHLQWDPERSVRGAALNHYSIQVGLGRGVIEAFAQDWVVGIEEKTALARKIHAMRTGKNRRHLPKHLPPERPYPVDPEVGRRLLLA